MKKSMNKLALVAFCLLIPACAAPTVPDTNKPVAAAKPTELKVGDKVEATFLDDFEPGPVVGMKYLYISSIQSERISVPPEEQLTEILEVKDNQVKLRITTQAKQQEKTMTKQQLKASGLTNGKFTYEGKEDITIPMGSYKDTTKLSLDTTDGKMYLWMVKGIGVVKSTIENTSGKIITEMKEFKTI